MGVWALGVVGIGICRALVPVLGGKVLRFMGFNNAVIPA